MNESTRTLAVTLGLIVTIPCVAQVDSAAPQTKLWEEVMSKCAADLLEVRPQLTLRSTGSSQRVLGRFPGTIAMRPAQGDQALPPGVKDALFGELFLGPREIRPPLGTSGRFGVVGANLGETTPRLWVDTNADGAFDAKEEVTLVREVVGAEGKQGSRWRGTSIVHASAGDLGVQLTIHDPRSPQAKVVDPADPSGTSRVHAVTFGGDWYREGKVALAGKEYDAVLFDELGAGDFRGPLGGNDSGVRLYLDVDANGKFDRSESFDPWKAFAVGGHTYRVRELGASGESFAIERVPVAAPAGEASTPEIGVGKSAPEFSFTALDRRTFKFPESYEDKVVILHFWTSDSATVRSEVQAVRAALTKVTWDNASAIGVCLDECRTIPGQDMAKERERVITNARVGASKGLTISWPVVCDALGARGELAKKFRPDANGRIVVMDAGTRTIIAAANEFSSEELARIVDDAVKAKRRPRK